jgi:hypothetical protein
MAVKKTTTEDKTQTTQVASAYTPSTSVHKAQDLLNQHLGKKLGEYQSQWQEQLNDTLDKILNREKFSYNLNGDALYQQYKDTYARQGQLAMMDTMGQAAALTGGYGNSYAQNVGQQAYQGYLQQLNDRVPELYQLALDQYNQEGQNLYNQYGLFADREAQDYSRYRDNLSDYYTELDRLTTDARYKGEFDYNMYRDQVADAQWQAQFDEAKRQYEEQMAKSTKKSSGGNSSNKGKGNDKDDDKPKDDTPTYDSIVKDLNTYIKNGASKSNISNYLRSAYQSGYITQEQYNKLKDQFTPRGYTY